MSLCRAGKLSQLKGKDLPEEKDKRISKCAKIVVAIYFRVRIKGYVAKDLTRKYISTASKSIGSIFKSSVGSNYSCKSKWSILCRRKWRISKLTFQLTNSVCTLHLMSRTIGRSITPKTTHLHPDDGVDEEQHCDQ